MNHHHGGHVLSAVSSTVGPPAGSPTSAADLLAIETRDVHKKFGRQPVLRGVSVQIPTGSATALLGPSGTGKSVLIKHILGLISPDKGEVRVHDRPLGEMSRREVLALRRSIGVMFQDGALFSSMDIYDNVAFPLRQHTDLGDHDVRQIVMGHLRAVGLEGAQHRRVNELSGGMRKRAGLARSLVLDPSILLCDEPDSGLDPVRTALLGELLAARHEELGGTVVVITHNIALAQLVADHVVLLWQGSVVGSGPAADMFASDDPFIQQFLAGETVGPLGMD